MMVRRARNNSRMHTKTGDYLLKQRRAWERAIFRFWEALPAENQPPR